MLLQRSNTNHKVARRWRLGSKKVLSWASVLPHQESDDLASNSKAHCFPRKHQSLGAWIFSECKLAWKIISLWGQISTSTWTSVVGKNITLKKKNQNLVVLFVGQLLPDDWLFIYNLVLRVSCPCSCSSDPQVPPSCCRKSYVCSKRNPKRKSRNPVCLRKKSKWKTSIYFVLQREI